MKRSEASARASVNAFCKLTRTLSAVVARHSRSTFVVGGDDDETRASRWRAAICAARQASRCILLSSTSKIGRPSAAAAPKLGVASMLDPGTTAAEGYSVWKRYATYLGASANSRVRCSKQSSRVRRMQGRRGRNSSQGTVDAANASRASHAQSAAPDLTSSSSSCKSLRTTNQTSSNILDSTHAPLPVADRASTPVVWIDLAALRRMSHMSSGSADS
mmetsp:Transcript_108820/g.316573  ORF Transcript_108820/g.316573 Transcript_108820/m.316573 type:complete len:218 (-) Transcript_108820:1048-1701(-)